MIRITSGIYRGRKVFTGNTLKAQPVMSVIRESIFNILRSHVCIEGLQVCDLFCGSGSLSFEALSRGAAYSCLVDIHAPNLRLAQKTAISLGVEHSLGAVCCDIRRLPWAERKYDLAFLDPPYTDPGLINVALKGIVDYEWCAAGSFVVLRVQKGYEVDMPDVYELIDRRTYCSSEILFMQL